MSARRRSRSSPGAGIVLEQHKHPRCSLRGDMGWAGRSAQPGGGGEGGSLLARLWDHRKPVVTPPKSGSSQGLALKLSWSLFAQGQVWG